MKCERCHQQIESGLLNVVNHYKECTGQVTANATDPSNADYSIIVGSKFFNLFTETLKKINMSDAKYYTPTVEEFYVGFEYEFRTLKEWEERKIDEVYDGYYCTLGSVKEGLKEDRIRVKYLDKEDIESLGFKYLGKSIHGWFELERDFGLGNYKIQIHYGYSDNGLCVKAVKGSNVHSLFDGIVKNKSELIKLLIQLRITTNVVSDESRY
jgi:hypothetical protein